MKNIRKVSGIPHRYKEMLDFCDLLGLDSSSEFMDYIGRLKIRSTGVFNEEQTTPDTFDCDCFFLEHFINPQMESDFSFIARDFLDHELQNLKEYETIQFLDTDCAKNWPDRVFEKFILNLMMNAVNGGSSYTKNLFLYLYKTYYRKEYQQLKRFSTLSIGELLGFATSNFGATITTFSRILTISRMIGIVINPNCNFVYVLFADLRSKIEMDCDEKFMDDTMDMYTDCLKDIVFLFESGNEITDLVYKCDKFVRNAFRAEGYEECYHELCNDHDDGIMDRLARTLAILKLTYKNRKFTKEEIIVYSSILEVTDALMSSSEAMENRLFDVVYGVQSEDDYDGSPSIFKSEAVEKIKADVSKSDRSIKEKSETKTVQQESARYNEDALIDEINILHRKIHEQEGSIKNLRSDLAGYRKTVEENSRLKEQMEADNKELAALREHLYSLTEDDEEVSPITMEAMKDALRKLHVVIVGGHSNWRLKMKQEFSDWIYIEPMVSGTLEASVVDKADQVYFFTDTLSHSTYFKYMNVVKEHGLKFGYIHGVNIEKTIRKIYKDMVC